LIAAVSDVVDPGERATVIGVYRFWRDSGFVFGALLAGFTADAFSAAAAIAVVAALTGASGLLVAATRWERSRRRDFVSGDGGHRQVPLGRSKRRFYRRDRTGSSV
jgi:MFS family permease